MLRRLSAMAATSLFLACGERVPEDARRRARTERVAQDTASRAWRHAVGVDSVRMRGDTTVVWVSPRDWQATDAPRTGVRVAPDGRVAADHWVLGG